MAHSQDRSANRQKRRDAKRSKSSHESLLRLVKEETDRFHVSPRRPFLNPLTEAQAVYDRAIFSGKITFGIGPAGTGKTWWAVMRAAEALYNKEIDKIVITRPAVEAGESMGFLPGELEEKYEPYLRPVADALTEYFGSGHFQYLMKSGAIEARPLAFLRGSTIKRSWLIADEMQNATKTQMKMLLTRIGEDAKFIINGDPTQCDLPRRSDSGLMDAVRRCQKIGGVFACFFDDGDVVRSGIAQEIVRAYSSSDDEAGVESYNSSIECETAGLERMLKVA